MQRTVVLTRTKARTDIRSLFERVTYTSMLSGFVGLVYYLAINCYHAV